MAAVGGRSNNAQGSPLERQKGPEGPERGAAAKAENDQKRKKEEEREHKKARVFCRAPI